MQPSEPSSSASRAGTRDDDLGDLYENAPCGYLSLQPDGRIVRVNATLCAWLGLERDQLLGRRFLDLLTTAGRIFYETHFAPLLRMQGFFHEVALDLVSASGERLPVIANAAERRSDGGDLQFIRVAIFRATQRRQYERDLVEARKEVERLNAELKGRVAEAEQTGEFREQFIAVLGHDLRNPLAALDAGTNRLLRRGWDDRSDEILRLMKASVTRMGGLIDNVLDLTRTRLGHGIQVQLEPGRDLAPTLQQVIDELLAVHPQRQIDTDFRLDWPVAVDHARIAQMFSNLLGNALTHGAENGAIRVEAWSSPTAFELAVANAGEPIPAELMSHLFKPFYRVDIRPSLQGLGLGLYIASQIASAHGGELTVSSNEQETRFTFRLPAA